jgi:hypothetical protein
MYESNSATPQAQRMLHESWRTMPIDGTEEHLRSAWDRSHWRFSRHAAMRGDNEAARSQFGAAVRIADEAGALAWLARALFHEGRFLVERGDTANGSASLDPASALAALHGLVYVTRRLAEVATSRRQGSDKR